MTFEEARGKYAQLLAAWQAGRLSPEQFSAQISALRVQDASGAWWQIDGSGQWLRWDGATWKPDAPPAAPPAWQVPTPSTPAWQAQSTPAWQAPAQSTPAWQAPSPSTPAWQIPAPSTPAWHAPAHSAPAWQTPAHPAPSAAPVPLDQALSAFKQKTIDPQEFLRETRQVPLRERSRGWFDLASILGGAVSGYIWFVYGSVRGMPLPKWFSTGARESWFDIIPTGVLIALPILAFLFRSTLMGRAQSLYGRVMGLTTKARLIWAALLVVGAWWVQTDTRFFQQREGLDFITPLIMVMLPAGLAWFRPQIDGLLRPLQPLRQPFPRPMLLGIGLAVPYGVAYLLYWMGWTQYPYLRLTVTLGTLLSYAVVRTPEPAGTPPRLSAASLLWPLTALVFLALGDTAFADDFLRDPFDLNDGLRTNNAAQVLAGSATAVVSMLVNGTEVVKTILYQPPPPGQPPPQTPQQENFQVLVDTVDGTGARSTKMAWGGNETIYVYANCAKAGVPFPTGDASIQFSSTMDTNFATLTDRGTANGRRLATVDLVKPQPKGQPPSALILTVSAGQDALVSSSVTLTLDCQQYILEIY